jgi:hypothetical protein
MPQEDDGGSQVNHSEEIVWVTFPADHDAAIVMQPRTGSVYRDLTNQRRNTNSLNLITTSAPRYLDIEVARLCGDGKLKLS